MGDGVTTEGLHDPEHAVAESLDGLGEVHGLVAGKTVEESEDTEAGDLHRETSHMRARVGEGSSDQPVPPLPPGNFTHDA